MIGDQICGCCGGPVEHPIFTVVCCESCLDRFDALLRMVSNVETIRGDLSQYLKAAAQPEIDCIPESFRSHIETMLVEMRRISVSRDAILFSLGEWESTREPLPYADRLHGRSVAEIERSSQDDDTFRMIIGGLYRDEGGRSDSE